VLYGTYVETILFSDDQTRVKLRAGKGDYINANFVNVRRQHFFYFMVICTFALIHCNPPQKDTVTSENGE